MGLALTFCSQSWIWKFWSCLCCDTLQLVMFGSCVV